MPDSVRAHTVCKGREELPGGRAVEPCERAPVTVHLDDHGGPPPGEASARKCGRADQRIRRDDRGRGELLQLAAHAERQQEVEEHSVERARSQRLGEPKAFISVPNSGPAGLVGGPEQAVVELRTSAGELKLVPEPAGTRGYDDLRRGASREPLGRGVRPSVASLPDHARMLAALDRQQDLEILQTTRRLIELEHQRTRSRGLSIER